MPSKPRFFLRQPPPGLRVTWIVLVALALLACGLFWPVTPQITQRLPGTDTWAFDESTFVWNIWYFKHALLDLHSSPLSTDLIWFPLGIDLILYTYNFFNALIALPLQLAISLPVASNLTLLLATTLSGFGTYLLALEVLGVWRSGSQPVRALRLAALLAGLIYAFGSNRAVYAALGHYDMVTTQWLPFFALYLLRLLRRKSWKDAVLAGLCFALAALAEMIFASFLALLALVLCLALWRHLQDRTRLVGRLALAVGVALLVWSPALLPIGREFLRSDYALAGWGESLKLSADLAGLVTPTDLNPLFSVTTPAEAAPSADESAPGASPRWIASLRAVVEGRGRFGDVNTVFVGYLTLLLAVLGAWAGRRAARPWMWTAVVFGVLCLGPLLQIHGRYRFSLDGLLPEGITFPLPFAILHFIPLVNANRAPNRNSVILMLALAVLAAYGVAWLLTRFATSARDSAPRLLKPARMYAVGGLLGILLLLEHLAIPLPTTDARVPAIYDQIAAEPGDFAVMQLPLGWRNSFGVLGSERTQLQYYQTAHGKPIIGGNISRAPAFKMEYFRRIPLFRALTDLEMYQEVEPAIDAAARAQAGALMALYDVRYLIVFPPIPGAYPYQDTWQRTQEYAAAVLPIEAAPFWEADGIKAYRMVPPEPPFPFRLDAGADQTEPYMGAGWHLDNREQPYQATASWSTAQQADFYLPLAGARDCTLRLAIAPLSYEGAPAQRVSISVNGEQVLPTTTLAAGWQTLSVPVPARLTNRGANRVRLEFAWTASPRKVFPDPLDRGAVGASGVISPVNLEAHGFGEAFISAFSASGEETSASVGRRGYNVAVFDARSGELLDRQGFDTSANTYEAARLAEYLTHVPTGRIVALATKDDATRHLTPDAIEAIRRLGSRAQGVDELAGKAHALIGVQGAAAGSAAEAIAPGDAFVRVSGDFRTLAAAVDWVELGP